MAVKFSFELGFGYSFITFTNQQNYRVYHAKDKSTIRIGCVLPLFPISCHLDDVWWAHASSNSKGNAKPLVVLFNYIQLLQKKSVGKILFCKRKGEGGGREETRNSVCYNKQVSIPKIFEYIAKMCCTKHQCTNPSALVSFKGSNLEDCQPGCIYLYSYLHYYINSCMCKKLFKLKECWNMHMG